MNQLETDLFVLFICYFNSKSFNENKWALPINASEMIALQYIVEREYMIDWSMGGLK